MDSQNDGTENLGALRGSHAHTPRPWSLSRWSFNPGKCRPATIYAGDEGMDEVAICHFDREPDSPETIEADARLIAAAPELLAACIAALNFVDDVKVQQQVIDAIERATSVV